MISMDRVRLAPAALLALAAACGAVSPAPRALVQAVDPASGELQVAEVDLPSADMAAVRGPAAVLVLGGQIDAGRISMGSSPDCALRRLASGAVQAIAPRCQAMLSAYAALERARAFFLSAGAEALAPAPVLVDPAADASLPAGLSYLPASDAFALLPGPAGARVPAALNAGAVAREAARRHVRSLIASHPDEAEALALFLGAAAAGDPQYLASSEPGGDPLGETDLSRPMRADAPSAAQLAGALWAWADQTGDLVGAAREALAAARALVSSRPGDGGSGASALLSLVAGQLDGAERDQACAVFRARLGTADGIAACP
jgi:hypothetical protein